ATSHEGRPTKIEGNPQHPASLGATDLFAQASVLGLYDPDRSQAVQHLGQISSWGAAQDMLTQQRRRWQMTHGQGVALLTPTVTSPSLAHLIQQWLTLCPQ